MTLDDLARQAQFTAEGLLECAVTAMRERVGGRGKLSAAKIEAEQHGAHGLAWLATYVEAIKEMAAYARRMHEEGRLGPTEELLTRIGLGFSFRGRLRIPGTVFAKLPGPRTLSCASAVGPSGGGGRACRV